jgi:antitoxin ParD1/3/4
MTTISVTVPDKLKDFLDAEVAAGGHASAGDYVLALLNEARKRKAWDKVEELVMQGLNSGPPIEATREYWEEKIRRFKERYPDAEES